MPEKVELINNKKAQSSMSILRNSILRGLKINDTLDVEEAYTNAVFIVIAVSVNVYPKAAVP